MTVISKSSVLTAFIQQLTAERDALASAVQAAHEATTHPESKAEDSHDTRAIEASYLTAGQSKRLTELTQLLGLFQLYLKQSSELTALKQVQLGSLIEIEHDRKKSLYLYASEGGGFSCKLDEKTIHVLTPQSVIGEALEGLQLNESSEIEIQGKTKEYKITDIQ